MLASEAVPAGSAGPPPRSAPSSPVPAPRVATLPAPGRHAARRGRLAGTPAGGVRPARPAPWALRPHHLTLVAVTAALGLALTTWWVVRSSPASVPLPPTVPAAASAPGTTAAADDQPLLPGAVPPLGAPAGPGRGGSADASGPAGEQEVVVHVAGDVRRPGLVVLPVGARVADAVEAAGGARRAADLTLLNLARPLVDGEQVVVGGAPAPVGPAGAAGAGGPGGEPAGGALVDLNTADQALLETLPGVGPVTATAILEWRAEHGGFTAVEELLEVDGIGEATLADLADLVTV